MKNVVIWGGIAVCCSILFSSSALAAKQLTDVDAAVDFQPLITNGKIATNGRVTKLNLTFKINEEVSEGDYFEFEYSGLTDMTLPKEVKASDGTTIIAERTPVVMGYSSAYVIQRNDSSDNFETTQPSEMGIHKQRITFTKDVEKFSNIEFALGLSQTTLRLSVSNRDYQIKSYLKVNDAEVFSTDVTVGASSVARFYDNLWFSEAKMYSNYKMDATFGFGFNQNANGFKTTISLADESADMYNIVKINPGSNIDAQDVYSYTNNSTVNSYGLVKIEHVSEAKYTVLESSDKELTYEVNDHNSNVLNSYLSFEIKLTEEGLKYLKEKNELPKVSFKYETVKPDGTSLSRATGSGEKKITITAKVATTLASTLEKEITNPKNQPEGPKKDEGVEEVITEDENLANKEINVPNTGFESNILPIFIAGISFFSLATFMIGKKI